MTTWDLTALLNAADAHASLPERHIWMVRLFEWLRHGQATVDAPGDATPAPVLRLRQLCQVLERHDDLRARVQGVLGSFLREVDAVTLLADFGFAPRASFASELARRIGAKLLPKTPDTRNLAELFGLIFKPSDESWISRIDDATLARLAGWWPQGHLRWREAVLDAVTVLCSAVRAAGFSAPLRLRMSEAALVNEPFRQLAQAGESLRLAASSGEAVASVQAVSHLRALLAECRTATDSVLEHLEEFGISLHIVFDVDQLRLRCERIEHLLDLLMAEQHQSAQELRRLLLVWVAALRATRSVRELVTEQSRQLSRRVAERSAETGEHYITRTRQEYAAMLRAALGGGAVIAGTTFLKFAIGALGLAMFWGGFWSGIVYAASFVVVMLMHWTVATKQRR